MVKNFLEIVEIKFSQKEIQFLSILNDTTVFTEKIFDFALKYKNIIEKDTENKFFLKKLKIEMDIFNSTADKPNELTELAKFINKIMPIISNILVIASTI